jgi:hypothetical protein
MVGAIAAIEGVVAATAREAVIASSAVEQVVAVASEEGIVPALSIQGIGAVTAGKTIVSISPEGGVIAAKSFQNIVATPSIQKIVEACTGQLVGVRISNPANHAFLPSSNNIPKCRASTARIVQAQDQFPAPLITVPAGLRAETASTVLNWARGQ